MGSGKTIVGKKLAASLKMKFVDLDQLIEKRTRKKIPQIFAQKGEEYFRKLETSALKSILKEKDSVIATGGGIVLKPHNLTLFHKLGKVFLLMASPEIIYQRVKDDKSRPLINLKGKEKLERIKKILKFRQPLYRAAADYVINTTKLTTEEAVDKIKKIWSIIKQ